jgi:DNA replication and repair protein RecF
MRVKKVTLKDFRNYEHCAIDLSPARNIVIGENAQGKTNFLEAIEIVSTGKSPRAQHEVDLICKGKQELKLEVTFDARGAEEVVCIIIRALPRTSVKRARTMEKQVQVNGLTQSALKGLKGRLVTVSFKSEDLYLLRGGPKYRRDWIDRILFTLKPTFGDISSKYQKVVVQRNRLLKTLCERGGRLSVTDQDQLRAWDVQLTRLSAQIVKQRCTLLLELLPMAERYQNHISDARELLTAHYNLCVKDTNIEPIEGENDDDDGLALTAEELSAASEAEIERKLLSLIKQRRFEEIARKQSLVGPHRDDIEFFLNGHLAEQFASQGQQRSLVLSLKLAELERVTDCIGEPPVLLLDDVLAELDLKRQGLLMSLVKNEMQTVITTTHVDGFRPEWLEGALFLSVAHGRINSPACDLQNV